jgi:protein-tyrosine phosphatase
LVDIHSHILPGLDDGPGSLEESVAMLRIAAQTGTTDITATPHANPRFRFDPELVSERIAELQRACGPVPLIHCGCDFHLTPENIQDALANPGKYAINHQRYLLVEFSDVMIPRSTMEIFDRFQAAGLTPIVTHPERNYLLHSRLDELQTWVENGCLVQVTGQSLLGRFGRSAKSVAAKLMDRNLVHFIASDAHDPKDRTPALDEAHSQVVRKWGEARAESLFVTAPRKVLRGEVLYHEPPEERRPRKWPWQS